MNSGAPAVDGNVGDGSRPSAVFGPKSALFVYIEHWRHSQFVVIVSTVRRGW